MLHQRSTDSRQAGRHGAPTCLVQSFFLLHLQHAGALPITAAGGKTLLTTILSWMDTIDSQPRKEVKCCDLQLNFENLTGKYQELLGKFFFLENNKLRNKNKELKSKMQAQDKRVELQPNSGVFILEKDLINYTVSNLTKPPLFAAPNLSKVAHFQKKFSTNDGKKSSCDKIKVKVAQP
jgi:hypothetical protein